MSGIMAAVAGGTQNIIYSAGLWNVSLGAADTAPIDASGTSIGGSAVNLNYTWIGYIRPSVTGTINLTIQSLYTEYINYFGTPYQINWGGGGSSIAYLWLGNTAISGYNTGNAEVNSNNNSATYAPSLIAGINYPLRLNWVCSLPYNPTGYLAEYPGYATGSFSFTNSNGAVYYNRLANGF